MCFMQREWIIWRKRTILWVLLGMVVVMAYFGYMDYLDPAVWKIQAAGIDMSANKTEEEKEFSYNLLAQVIWMMQANNSLFEFFPLFLVGMSFGVDLHTRRDYGMRLAGMKPKQLFGISVCTSMLLTLGLILLGMGISLWKLRDIWYGHLNYAEFLFLIRPIVKIVLSVFCCTSMAYLCFSLFGKKNLIIPYMVYLLGTLLVYRVIVMTANLLAWGSVTVKNGGSFTSYYFWDVDQRGVENVFLGQVEEPLQWKLWGETMLIGYAVVGIFLLFIAWKVFYRSQKAI